MSIPKGASSGRSKVRGYGSFPVRSESHVTTSSDSRLTGSPGWDGMGRGGAKSSYVRPSVPSDVTLDGRGTQAWSDALVELERIVSVHMFRLWIEPLRFVGVSKDSVVLTGDYRLARWVARRYGSVIGDVCRGLGFRGALICEEGER